MTAHVVVKTGPGTKPSMGDVLAVAEQKLLAARCACAVCLIHTNSLSQRSSPYPAESAREEKILNIIS